MSVSLEYLERCAADTGHGVGPLEKVVRLGELSADIARHPFLGEALALKGGTAMYLCFGPPKRLSVDLDYNYIMHLDRDAMLVDRPRIEDAVVELAKRRGYNVQRSADTFAGRKLFLGYKSRSGPDARIEVDLNFLFRLPLSGTRMMEMWQPGELDKPRVKVVSAIELCVGKLLALLDRSAPRDVWDAVRLRERFPEMLQSPVLRAWFIALSVSLDHPLGTYTRERLEGRLTDRTLKEQLVPMLAQGENMDVGDLIDRAWTVLKPLMRLDDKEKQFIEKVHEGELCPSLACSNDPVLAEEIAKHPAIMWKLINVREHASKRTDS